ncbi:hypothetical protein [Phenylobacterium sp.]|nr:hypothetical protein [Phenylobacterium sp.]
MLIGAAGAFELAAWRTTRPLHLSLVSAAIGLAFLLIWAQLAVGIW